MSILEIYIENIKSITSGKARFTDGINFIYGPNGAGKSSILDALAFALYGSEWLRRCRLKLSDIIRVKSKIGIVRVKIRGIDGKIYTIQRAITPEKSLEANTYVLDESGKRVASRDKEVTQFIERVLNIPLSVFAELLYVRQGELRDILEGSRKTETRLDKVLRIETLEKLRIEHLKEAKKLVELHIRRIEGKLSILNEEISKLNNNITNMLKERDKYSATISQLENKYNEIVSRKNKLESQLKECEKVIEKLKRYEIALQEKLNMLNELKKREEELRKSVEGIKYLEKRLQELDELSSRLNELKNKKDSLIREKTRLESELHKVLESERIYTKLKDILKRNIEHYNRVRKEVEEIEKAKTKLAELERKLEKIEKYRELLEKLIKKEAKLSMLRSRLEEEVKLLNDAKGICPLCRRELDEKAKRELLKDRYENIKKTEKRLQVIKRKINKINNILKKEKEIREIYYSLKERTQREQELIIRLRDLERDIQNIRSELLNLENYISKRKEIERELERVGIEIDDVNRQIEQIERKLKERDVIVSKLATCNRAIQELEEVRKKILNLEEEVKNIEDTISNLRTECRKYEDVKKEYEVICEEEKSILENLNQIRGRLQTIDSQIERFSKELDEKRKLKNLLLDEYDRYIKAHRFINKVIDTVDKVKPVIRRIFLELLNAELNSMFLEVCHKSAFVGLRINDDYEIFVKRRDGVELSIDTLSIGEKNLIALLFRFALAKVVLGNIPFLILDEPTEHLDDEHRRRIAQWLKDISGDVGMIIITSHVDSFETVADNIIRVEFANEKGESTFRNT